MDKTVETTKPNVGLFSIQDPLLPFLSTFSISRLSKRFFSTSMLSGSNNFRSGLFRGLVNESSQQFFSRDF